VTAIRAQSTLSLCSLISLKEVDNLADLRQLGDSVLRLVEVDPVGLVDVPAAIAVHHVALCAYVVSFFDLSVDHVLRQVHLVDVLPLMVRYE